MKLAEIYELQDNPRKALDLVYQGLLYISLRRVMVTFVFAVINARKRTAASDIGEQGSVSMDVDDPGMSLFSEAKQKKGKQKASTKSGTNVSRESLVELEERKEAEAVRSYERLKQIWDGMLQQDESLTIEWLVEAEKLIDMFRETRNLFGSRGVSFKLEYFDIKLSTIPVRRFPFGG